MNDTNVYLQPDKHITKPHPKSGVGFYQFGFQVDDVDDNDNANYYGHTEHVDTATNSKVGESIHHVSTIRVIWSEQKNLLKS